MAVVVVSELALVNKIFKTNDAVCRAYKVRMRVCTGVKQCDVHVSSRQATIMGRSGGSNGTHVVKMGRYRMI